MRGKLLWGGLLTVMATGAIASCSGSEGAVGVEVGADALNAVRGYMSARNGGLDPGRASVGGVYTTDADFDEGTLDGVNHDAPNNDQLQLNRISRTEPYIWIANWTLGTVTKMDTRTGRQVAKYDSVLVQNWDGVPVQVRPPREYGSFSVTVPCGNSPSRTAVDGDGNAYVANRTFCGYASVTKYAGDISGCVDRNGNGQVDTSGDVDGNGIINIDDPEEFKGQSDECILWTRNFAGEKDYGRSLAVDAEQNVWAGGYNTGRLYKLSGETGAVLQAIDPNAETGLQMMLYGIAIGPGGYIYTTDITQGIYQKIDPKAPPGQRVVATLQGPIAYGLAVDRNGVLWLGHWSEGGGVIRVDFDANRVDTFGHYVGGCGGYTRGVAVDGGGNVWVACWNGNRLLKFSSDGQFLGSWPVDLGPIGVGVDGDGRIWTVNQASNTATRLDPVTGTTASFPVSGEPYSYSDMTGFQQRNFTVRQGSWTIVHDGGRAGGRWGTVTWNTEPQGSTPAGTSITAKARAADTVGELASQPWSDVVNGIPFDLTGRYLEVKATLRVLSGDASPVLSDLRITPTNQAPVAVCKNAEACAGPGTCAANADINGGSYDPDGDPLTWTQNPAGPYPIGSHLVSLVVSDGERDSACEAVVTVKDCEPPTITCPPSQVVECTSPSGAVVDPGQATASDLCSGVTVTQHGPATFPVGTTLLTYTAVDGAGNGASCDISITVKDDGPPVVTSPGAGDLWPPNHKYVRIGLVEDCGIELHDSCGGVIDPTTAQLAITCVTSDEEEDGHGNGDGKTLKDMVIVDATHVDLRSERDGTHDGRVYQIGFSVKDAAGNVAYGTCPVGVPHDRSGRKPVDSGERYRVCRTGASTPAGR